MRRNTKHTTHTKSKKVVKEKTLMLYRYGERDKEARCQLDSGSK